MPFQVALPTGQDRMKMNSGTCWHPSLLFKEMLLMANVIAPEALVSQLRWRYATKKFDPARLISEQDWAALEEALILTPSSYGLQPWKFVVITDPIVKAKLPAIELDGALDIAGADNRMRPSKHGDQASFSSPQDSEN